MVDQPNLADIERRLGVVEHELKSLADPHPANGAEITLAYRKVQEALLYVQKAKEQES